MGEAITCSAPVYVLVFTCGRQGSRSLRRCPTRPASIRGHWAALSSHPHQVRDSSAPCPLGGPRGPVALLHGLLALSHWARPPRNARVFVCLQYACVSVCARVWARQCEFPCRFPVQTPGLRPPDRGPPSSTPIPSFPRSGKFAPGRCAAGESSCTSAAPPLTHPAPPAPPFQLPPGFCSRAGTSLPRTRRLPSLLPVADSERPPGRARWSGAGRLRPRPRPRQGSGLRSTPSTADPVPSPAVARRWPETAPLASDFTAYWIWLLTYEGASGATAKLSYLAALTKLAIGLYCHPPLLCREPTLVHSQPAPQTQGKPLGIRQRRLGFHQNRPRPSSHTPRGWGCPSRTSVSPSPGVGVCPGEQACQFWPLRSMARFLSGS